MTVKINCGLASNTIGIALKRITLPNVFTPNDDGKNDVFSIENYVKGGRIVLSNRWGQPVYHSENYANDWKAENVSDGIYFCELDSGCEVVKGWVQVVR